MKLVVGVLLCSMTAAGFGQEDPAHARFVKWCEHYGRVRVLLSNNVECQRHYNCSIDIDREGREVEALNRESDQSSMEYFWKENSAVWGLIDCRLVGANEQVVWIQRILSGGSHRPLPITDDVRKCLI